MFTRTRFTTMFAALLVGGTVFSRPADSSATPRLDDSVLETKTEGLRRDLGDGVILTLAPGTRVVRHGRLRVILSNGDAARAHHLELVSGRLDVEVNKLGSTPTPVVVRGPRRITGLVKLGQAIIKADEGAVVVVALRGDMMAAVGNRWRQLAPGFVRAFTKAEPDGKPRPIIAAAETSTETSLLVALPGQRIAGRATWPAVPGATSYDVVIDRLEGSERETVRQVTTDQLETSLDDLRPGNYELSVRAVDEVGISSLASPPLALRVVGIELPEGAYSSGETIMLGRYQRVRLTHAQGLELTYDGAQHFVPAPDSAGLNRGRQVVVRLREHGRKDEARLKLAPTVLTSDVELEPRLAEWPGDTVTVRIVVRSESGAPQGQGATLRPEVTINGREVAPRWTRRDDLWLGTVPTPTAPGPWVVRVHVFDPSGELTGRASLEVARHSTK